MKMPHAEKRRAKSWQALVEAAQAAGRPVDDRARCHGSQGWTHTWVKVQTLGYLPIPRLVLHLFDLLPTDELLLDPAPAGAGLGLLPIRELLGSLYRGGVPWGRLCRELRHHPVGVVTPEGTLRVASRIFPAEVGETLVWLLRDEGGQFQVSLFRWLGSEPSQPSEEAAKPPIRKRGAGRRADKAPAAGGTGRS